MLLLIKKFLSLIKENKIWLGYMFSGNAIVPDYH